MFIRVEEHEDDHHAVVRGPPDDEGGHDHDTDAEALHLGSMDEAASVDVVFASRVLCSFKLEGFVTVCEEEKNIQEQSSK